VGGSPIAIDLAIDSANQAHYSYQTLFRMDLLLQRAGGAQVSMVATASGATLVHLHLHLDWNQELRPVAGFAAEEPG